MEQALKNQIRRLTKKLEQLEKLSSRISTFRLFNAVFGIALVYLAAKTHNTWLFIGIIALGIGLFTGLVRWHKKIDKWVEKITQWIEIRQRHIARMNLDWDEIPKTIQQGTYQDHPFARDLDITKNQSLLQLLNTSIYPGGISKLEKWLTQTKIDLKALKNRQQLVKELKPMAHFRDRLQLNATIARKKRKEKDWEMEDLLLWLQSTQRSDIKTPLLIVGSLSIINIVLLVLYLVGIIDPYVIFTFIIYAITYNFFSSKSSGLFGEAQQINKLLSQFRPVLAFLENFSYKKGSALHTHCKPFFESEQRPSRWLKKIIRITSAASSQNNEFLWLALNMVMPWDLYFTQKLNEYKVDLAKNLPVWLQQFYELEALNSMANFAWLNDGYTFALPDESMISPVLSATSLGHPLIAKSKKVKNDVTIENIGDILLITGSNMAGKSTFLRTLGINLCLCFAGAPVNAAQFKTIPFRVFSSINVTDSLGEGLSHFYAEVKRLRIMLDALNLDDKYPLFFMVDEIYRGTNNKERLIGSDAFLKDVAGKNGVGLISTHDLELARLDNEIETLSNWHFEETIEDGKMQFEYKLKSGPCPTTNALKIMEMEGLPV